MKIVRKIMSRKVIVDGILHSCYIVNIDDEGKTLLKPFVKEEAGVEFVDRIININTNAVPHKITFSDSIDNDFGK